MAGLPVLLLVLAAVIAWADDPPPAPKPTVYADDVLPFGTRRLSHGFGESDFQRRRDATVSDALAWLAAHQDPDGRFGAASFASWCRGKKQDASPEAGTGDPTHDVGVTGLAVAAFLHAGYTHRGSHPYATTLRRALRWLTSRQRASGCFGTTDDERFMYDHAFAAFAVLNAYAMTGSPTLRRSSQAALDFIERCRNPNQAWGYGIRSGRNDTSVTGAVMLPITTAQFVVLASRQTERTSPFPRPGIGAFNVATAWFRNATDSRTGRVGYREMGSRPKRYDNDGDSRFDPLFSECPTAIALLFSTAPWATPKKGQLGGMIGLLADTPPKWLPKSGAVDLLYWWYGAMAMARVDGTRAETWIRAAENALLGSQRTDGDVCAFKGSWDPVGVWGRRGGRAYATAVSVLTLRARAAFPWGQTEELTLTKLIAQKGAEPERRLRAMRAAATQPNVQTTNGALLALNDEDPRIRRAAAVTLGRVGPLSRAKRTLDALAAVAEKDTDPGVRRAAVWAMGRAGEGKRQARTMLGKLTYREDPGWRFLHAVSVARVRKKPHDGLAGSLRHVRDPDLLIEAARDRGLIPALAGANEAKAASRRFTRYLGLPPTATVPGTTRTFPSLASVLPPSSTIGPRLLALLDDVESRRGRYEDVRQAAGEVLRATSGSQVMAGADLDEPAAVAVLQGGLARLILARYARELMQADEGVRARERVTRQVLWEHGRALTSSTRSNLAALRAGWDGPNATELRVAAELLWIEADYNWSWFGHTLQGEDRGLRHSFDALDEAIWRWDGTRTARYLSLRKAELLGDFARATEDDDVRASLYEGVLLLYADAAIGDPRDLPDRHLTMRAFDARARVCLEARRVGRFNFLRRGRGLATELLERVPDLGADPTDEQAIASTARLLNRGGDQNRAVTLLETCGIRAGKAGHTALSVRLRALRVRLLRGE